MTAGCMGRSIDRSIDRRYHSCMAGDNLGFGYSMQLNRRTKSTAELARPWSQPFVYFPPPLLDRASEVMH